MQRKAYPRDIHGLGPIAQRLNEIAPVQRDRAGASIASASKNPPVLQRSATAPVHFHEGARARNSETIEAAVALFSTCSREKMFFRCTFTVPVATPRMMPISSFVLPFANQYSTLVARGPNPK
jgi:hypothetical protein